MQKEEGRMKNSIPAQSAQISFLHSSFCFADL